MKAFHLIISAILLTGCAGAGSDSSQRSLDTVEAIGITQRAVDFMGDCIDDHVRSSCRQGKRYLEKYPWLLTRNVHFTNSSGMLQDEWDSQVRVIQRNLDIISSRHALFEVEEYNLR